MRLMAIGFLGLLLGLAPNCLAQQWELGGIGGLGIQKGLTAKAGTGAAETGFESGGAWGAFAGQNLYDRLGGEIRYLFRWSDLRVASGGQKATFAGNSHIVHYDLLYHTAAREKTVRPFVAVGGGIKVFQGTGIERAFQPLRQFVLLTKKREVLPTLAVGAGVKWKVRGYLSFRVEVRDFVTPPPQKVLVPAPGARITGWLHDIVPLVGLGFTF